MAFKYAEFLAQNVNLLLRREGISKAALARNAEVSRPVIDNILAGTANPELKTVDKIAECFGVDTLDLLKPNFDPKASIRLADVREVKKTSEILAALAIDIEALRGRVEDIPVDLLDMLTGQESFVYDAIRKTLEPLQTEKPGSKAKALERKKARKGF